jgi:hypothetical protein
MYNDIRWLYFLSLTELPKGFRHIIATKKKNFTCFMIKNMEGRFIDGLDSDKSLFSDCHTGLDPVSSRGTR